MVKNKIVRQLKELVGHDYVAVVKRGNSAINSAFSVVNKYKKVLIPAEGGWLHYKTASKMAGLNVVEVSCDDAKIDLHDLKEKLLTGEFGALIYQNPGGYFAEQKVKRIKELCSEFNCLVILDVSGSLGTKLCSGKFADLVVGSFGKWKLVEAKVGGFISMSDKELWDKLGKNLDFLNDDVSLLKINQKLNELPERIRFLESVRDKIVTDLLEQGKSIVYPDELGFVVLVKFTTDYEKDNIINYCQLHKYEWTECPRYIRLNKKAISIEVKRLQQN
tara:strand:+ start:47 stop:874 length:828 start_codon:yes stop_codon:yes gene_type:complete